MSKPREESLSKRVVFQAEEQSVFFHLHTYSKWTNFSSVANELLKQLNGLITKHDFVYKVPKSRVELILATSILAGHIWIQTFCHLRRFGMPTFWHRRRSGTWKFCLEIFSRAFQLRDIFAPWTF